MFEMDFKKLKPHSRLPYSLFESNKCLYRAYVLIPVDTSLNNGDILNINIYRTSFLRIIYKNMYANVSYIENRKYLYLWTYKSTRFILFNWIDNFWKQCY